MKNINSYFQSTHNSSLGLSFPGPLPCIQNSNQTGFIYQPTNYVEHLYKSRTLVGIWLWIHWVSYNCSSTVCVTNYRLSLISILGITRPSYIVGLNMNSIGWQDCQCCYTSNCFKQHGLDYNSLWNLSPWLLLLFYCCQHYWI